MLNFNEFRWVLAQKHLAPPLFSWLGGLVVLRGLLFFEKFSFNFENSIRENCLNCGYKYPQRKKNNAVAAPPKPLLIGLPQASKVFSPARILAEGQNSGGKQFFNLEVLKICSAQIKLENNKILYS